MTALNYNHVGTPKSIDRITTARLPSGTRQKLETLARVTLKTKTEVLIEAIDMYYEKEDNELDSYTLGLPFFPKKDDPPLGPSDLAENHKEYYYKALVEKHKRESEEFDKYVEEGRKKKALEKKQQEKQNERKSIN